MSRVQFDKNENKVQLVSPSGAALSDDTGIKVQGGGGGGGGGTVAIDQSTPGTTNAVQVTGAVPLPAGAATAAKQPALGTAGTPSTDVLSMQGIVSGTPLNTVRGEGYTTASFAAVTADPALAGADVSAYSWVSVQITINASADTLTFQCSNDNVTWVACTLFPVSSTTAGGVTSTTTTGVWEGALPGQFFRVAHTGGNAVTGFVLFKQTPGIAPALGVTSALTPSTSSGNGGSSVRVASAATTNGTNVKASAGILLAVNAANTTASVKYMKLYNKSSAPTVGTDTPIDVIALAPTSTTVVTFGTYGLGCSAGIGFGLTGAAPDADTTALAANDVFATVIYK